MALTGIRIRRGVFKFVLFHRDILPNLPQDYACPHALNLLYLLLISQPVPVFQFALVFLLFLLSTIQEFVLQFVRMVLGLIITVEHASPSV